MGGKQGDGVRGVNFEGGRRLISKWLGLSGSDFYILSIQKTMIAIPVLHISTI